VTHEKSETYDVAGQRPVEACPIRPGKMPDDARLLPLPSGSDGQTPVAKVFLDLGVATVGLAARFANRLPLTTTLPLPSIEGHGEPFGARKILRQKLV